MKSETKDKYWVCFRWPEDKPDVVRYAALNDGEPLELEAEDADMYVAERLKLGAAYAAVWRERI